MHYLSQIIFVLVLGVASYFIFNRIRQIRSNILLGKEEDRSDKKSERFSKMLLVAFGQQKMFKKPIPAVLHLFVYLGFVIINLEVLEFVLDGFFGTHRILAPYLGSFYGVLMNSFEFLALMVIVSCTLFLIRRNVIKVERFTKPEMKGWPGMDGNLILVIEIVLMMAILKMNASDQILQSRGVAGYPITGTLHISSMLIPVLDMFSTEMVILTERMAWWFHIIGILGFALFVTYSKHLHIFLAFPNTYYSNLETKGKIKNMEVVTNEVKMMLGMSVEQSGEAPAVVERFGAKDATDLSWKSLMEAYSCTECGRCTAECPANQTGKKLSPRKIMMDTRDRIEEIGAGKEEGKTLFGDFVTKEEINACTSCNACTEACPINIDPLSIILEMKRFVAMEESGAPASWNAMFSNIETNFAPWKFAPTDRFKWSKELNKENS
ncbi:MAG: (Fe-S)-binding protein [Reichenbachiella sp.]